MVISALGKDLNHAIGNQISPGKLKHYIFNYNDLVSHVTTLLFQFKGRQSYAE